MRQQNLRKLLIEYETQEVLADKIGVSPGYVSQLLNGTRPITEKTARKFEKRLNLPEFWFDRLDGSGPLVTIEQKVEGSTMEIKDGKSSYLTVAGRDQHNIPEKNRIINIDTRKVPIMEAQQILAGQSPSELNDDNHHNWIERAPSVPLNSYAFIMPNNSMTNPSGGRSIPAGYQIIIDPNQKPEQGDIAIIRYGETILIKQLEVDGPNKNLVALNPQYPPIAMTDDCTVLGKVIWAGLPF